MYRRHICRCIFSSNFIKNTIDLSLIVDMTGSMDLFSILLLPLLYLEKESHHTSYLLFYFFSDGIRTKAKKTVN